MQGSALPVVLSAACVCKERLHEIDEGMPEMFLRLAAEYMQG